MTLDTSDLARRVYRTSHLTGSFVLRSGATSSEYFDKYRFESDPGLLRELAEQGAAILLFTSELPEIQLVCDRALVVYRGAVTAELPAAEADEAALLHAAHGLAPARVSAA